ncbi:hypothetical protein PIB30_097395, partial [Stylosanthes scabra]|nr:hypothetical protein [Stylosanthes scabra]
FISSCGEIPNVPLMGPRGCISYTPTLVLRQLGQFQVVPKKNSMGGYNHLYQNEDTREIEDKIKKAWKNMKIQKTKGLIDQGTTHSPEYKTWRDNRIKGISVSTNLLSKSCCGQSREACLLASELEVAKAQASFLKEKKEAAETEILIFQSCCRKMAKEIENLKYECADVVERSRKGKDKVTDTLFAEIQDLKEKLCVRERQLKKVSDSKKELRFKMEMKIHQKEEVIQELNLEARKERESREILEQEVENLSALLTRRENECLQGWESSNRYRSMMINATEYGHFWRREALEKRKDVEELKRKYAQASESITNFIPSFVNQFEKAKE